MATHSSILAWRIPWTEEPGGLNPWGRKELDTTEQLTLAASFTFHCLVDVLLGAGCVLTFLYLIFLLVDHVMIS